MHSTTVLTIKKVTIYIFLKFINFRFFLDDDEKLASFHDNYSSGKMLTGELKQELIKVLQELVGNHQEARAKVTDDVVKQFMTPRKLNFDETIFAKIDT